MSTSATKLARKSTFSHHQTRQTLALKTLVFFALLSVHQCNLRHSCLGYLGYAKADILVEVPGKCVNVVSVEKQ